VPDVNAVAVPGTVPVLVALIPPGPLTASFTTLAGTAYLGSPAVTTGNGYPVTPSQPWTFTQPAAALGGFMHALPASGIVTVAWSLGGAVMPRRTPRYGCKVTRITRVVPAGAVPGYRDHRTGSGAAGTSGYNPPGLRTARLQTSPPVAVPGGATRENAGGEPDISSNQEGGGHAIHE
jgi:hypothetical protein